MDIVDPNLLEKLAEAEENKPPEEAAEEPAEGASEEPADEGESWGGWFSRLKTESLAKIAAEAIATVKRDIDEFKHAVAGAQRERNAGAAG